MLCWGLILLTFMDDICNWCLYDDGISLYICINISLYICGLKFVSKSIWFGLWISCQLDSDREIDSWQFLFSWVQHAFLCRFTFDRNFFCFNGMLDTIYFDRIMLSSVGKIRFFCRLGMIGIRNPNVSKHFFFCRVCTDGNNFPVGNPTGNFHFPVKLAL